MTAEIIERACNSTAAVLERACGADLDQPTPCLSWNARDLINHVIGSAAAFAQIAETGSYPAGDTEHDRTAGDFSEAFRQQAQRVVAAFSAPDAMSKAMRLPFGEVPARYASGSRPVTFSPTAGIWPRRSGSLPIWIPAWPSSCSPG